MRGVRSNPRKAPIASRETLIARIFPSIQTSISVLLPLDRIESFSIALLPRRHRRSVERC
jgi:hypothetical protein